MSEERALYVALYRATKQALEYQARVKELEATATKLANIVTQVGAQCLSVTTEGTYPKSLAGLCLTNTDVKVLESITPNGMFQGVEKIGYRGRTNTDTKG